MNLPIVILPGFLEGATAYTKLEDSLDELGFPSITVPLRRRDWLVTLGGKSVTPIIEALDKTVNQALQDFNVSQVNLIGHSAGGWISRIYMGEFGYQGKKDKEPRYWKAYTSIANLITLGTPHISKEPWTQWNLDFVNDNYPGAFYSSVRYVCVAGKTIFGKRRLGTWVAHNSYEMTCGIGNTWGDGITPIEAAHLQGAENLVIEGVMHSPRSSGIWYGSPEVLHNWVSYLT
jgi:triacylglycerol esterase/lipase EstA (alpha/beta hydrolase family)